MLGDCNVSSENLIEIVDRPTTVKTRIIAHSQQVARVDQEVDEQLNDEQSRRVVQVISKLVTLADSIVISDYAKGFLTNFVLSEILMAARDAGKNVLVDPKGKDYTKYRGASLLTPNRREAADACGLDEDGQSVVDIAGERLMSDHDFRAVLITQGEEGMTLFRRDGQPVHLDAMARSVFDVTGAGDTVIATLAASVGAGTDLETAARLANIAAGLVVEQVGTTAIRADDLRKALDGG
jgi:D-beta-D-heptose 7-phosphate kinase/D-beta-D-heptose 1-phosphate adenosyltransferase